MILDVNYALTLSPKRKQLIVPGADSLAPLKVPLCGSGCLALRSTNSSFGGVVVDGLEDSGMGMIGSTIAVLVALVAHVADHGENVLKSKLWWCPAFNQHVRILARCVENLGILVGCRAIRVGLGGHFSVCTDQKLPGSHDGKTLGGWWR